MDLRTIMNNDTAGASNPRQSRQSPDQTPSHSEYKHQQHAAASHYPPSYAGRPPQPPPLQRLHTSPDPTYNSVQSPYQYNSASSLSAQPQHAQSPRAPPYAGPSRDSYSGYNQAQQPQSAGVLASPYTPQPMSAGIPPEQQSYFPHQRSQSIQSVATPYGPSRYSYHSRDSPHSGPPQSVQSHQFSPSAQGSLPGTPIRPPANVPQHHSSPYRRPQSSGHDSLPNQVSSPWTGRNSHPPDQMAMSPDAQPRYSYQDAKQVDQDARQDSGGTQRERSESVSPKTVSAAGNRQENEGVDTAPHWNHTEERRLKESPSGSISQTAMCQGAPVPRPSPGAPQTSSSSPRPLSSGRAPTEDPKYPLPSKMNGALGPRVSSSPRPPQRKKRRYNEVPIYAQRSSHAKGKGPVIPNRHPPIPKHLRNSAQNPWVQSKRRSSANVPATTPASTSKSHAEATPPVNGPPAQQPPEPPQVGLLGPWEPSISGFIPHEEITKLVCDFLFQHVVVRDDVAAAPAGSAAPGQGAIIEVEGKLGHLIDMERGDRLHLPILTESILNREHPRFRTSFESSMTLAQHRVMNNFLNEAVKASMPHSNPGRLPLSYAHKKERDTFYEIQPSDLPPVIRQNLHPRHKPKVRVTTDQRTGEVLAKIVKCRIADLDVHSPRTVVDWRISVNLEMSYDGDVRHLPVVDGARGSRGGDRNKDRMSYRHLAYQIDLTQVAKAEPPSKSDFEHELEVEVSAAEIRRQGHLAMAGDPKNQYEDLIKGFIDNIRVLARAVPP